MDNSQTQEIKNRIDIVEVVRESIPHLKPSGSNWKGICPFHNEKTPSFMVSQDKQIWHCFGCNEGGDVFSFVMKIQNLEFVDALKQLADRAGIVLSKGDPAAASLRNTLIDIHAHARELYMQELLGERGKAAREYLKKRGITKELVLELGLGQSPAGWDKLYTLLVQNNYSNKQILASGLVLKNDNGKYFDRFRDRLMFSLIDAQGQIIGMAGRTLKDDAKEAKYINSPQTALYNKSNFLYGFYHAKQSIRKEDLVIVVEGYFDWIALYKNGYTNAVAVSGTALTENHMTSLKRYTKNIAFALDTDEAGLRALERSVALALAFECTPFVMDYRSFNNATYKDPDELLTAHPKAWNDVVRKKEHALTYYIRKESDALAARDITVRKKALAFLLPFLKRMKSAVDRDHFIKEIALRSNISEESLKEELQAVRLDDNSAYAAMPREIAPIRREKGSPRRERLMEWMAFVITEPEYFGDVLHILSPEDVYDTDLRGVFIALEEHFKRDKKLPDRTSLIRMIEYPKELERWLIKLEDLISEFTDIEKQQELQLLTRRIKRDSLQYRMELISNQLAKAESAQDQKQVDTLMREYRKLTDMFTHLQ